VKLVVVDPLAKFKSRQPASAAWMADALSPRHPAGLTGPGSAVVATAVSTAGSLGPLPDKYAFLATDTRTNEQTDRRTSPLR